MEMRQSMKGHAWPKVLEWTRWSVGLRSHTVPWTPSFGARDLPIHDHSWAVLGSQRQTSLARVQEQLYYQT